MKLSIFVHIADLFLLFAELRIHMAVTLVDSTVHKDCIHVICNMHYCITVL